MTDKTLLDEFAMAALGIVLNVLPQEHTWSFANVAEAAYDMAQAMLDEKIKREDERVHQDTNEENLAHVYRPIEFLGER